MDTERECVDTEGKYTDWLKPALHGTAFDNKFVVKVDYKCMGMEGEKHVEINQPEDMKSLMKSEFFVDLLTHGPLYISKVQYSCKNKNNAYTVHEKFAKGRFETAVLFEKLNHSFVEEFLVDLKFTEGGKEAAKFGELITALAKVFRIKIGRVKSVREGSDVKVGEEVQASLDFSKWYRDHFNEDRKAFLNTKVGSAFTGAYISDSSLATLDSSNEEVLLIPLFAYHEGRFEFAAIVKKIDTSSYRIKFDAPGSPEGVVLRSNMLVIGSAEYLIYSSILHMGDNMQKRVAWTEPERTEADTQCHTGKRHTKNNMGPKYDDELSAYNANDPGSGLSCDLYRDEHEERERMMRLREQQARIDRSNTQVSTETSACSLL